MDEKLTYINLLKDILLKKKTVMDALYTLTSEQNRVLTEENINIEEFEIILPKKEKLIEQLNRLDRGFSDAYGKVQGLLQKEKEAYKEEILALQDSIRSLTELGVRLQALEQQNKSKFAIYLSGQRKQIKDFKVNSRTASNYYKNMSGTPQGESYFMDKRK